MKILFNRLIRIFYWLILLFVVLLAGVSLLSIVDLPKKYHLFVVESGSMEPAIKTGSLIFTQASGRYFNGDIVSFKLHSYSNLKDPRAIVTHRIISVNESTTSGTFYLTKGDANNIQDPNPRFSDTVIGRVRLAVPYIGYPILFAKTQTGFILLIVIPATLIVYTEILNIKNEAKRLIAERKKRKLTAFETVEEKAGEEIIAAEKAVKKAVKNSKK